MEVIMKKETTPGSLSKQAECQSVWDRLLTQRDAQKRFHTWGGKQCPNRANATFVEQICSCCFPNGICFRPTLTTAPSISSILAASEIRCWTPEGLHEETYFVNPPELHLAWSKGKGAGERLDKGDQREGQGENARNTATRLVSLFSRCPSCSSLDYWSTIVCSKYVVFTQINENRGQGGRCACCVVSPIVSHLTCYNVSLQSRYRLPLGRWWRRRTGNVL